jgi:hypothetical protein
MLFVLMLLTDAMACDRPADVEKQLLEAAERQGVKIYVWFNDTEMIALGKTMYLKGPISNGCVGPPKGYADTEMAAYQYFGKTMAELFPPTKEP